MQPISYYGLLKFKFNDRHYRLLFTNDKLAQKYTSSYMHTYVIHINTYTYWQDNIKHNIISIFKKNKSIRKTFCNVNS